MRNYSKEINYMLPGDSEFDKLLRKEALQFIELFNEAAIMFIDYDKDVPRYYGNRDDILIKYRQLQHDYIELNQKINIFKQSIVQLRDRITKIDNEPPMWDKLLLYKPRDKLNE
jgi:hypothetical protein